MLTLLRTLSQENVQEEEEIHGEEEKEEEEDLNKTICNLSNLIQFHLYSIAFSFKSFTSL